MAQPKITIDKGWLACWRCRSRNSSGGSNPVDWVSRFSSGGPFDSNPNVIRCRACGAYGHVLPRNESGEEDIVPARWWQIAWAWVQRLDWGDL